MLEADRLSQATALLGAASKASSLETKAVYLAVARGLLDVERERLASADGLFEAQEKELVRVAENKVGAP